MARTRSRRATGHGGIIGAFVTAMAMGLGLMVQVPAIGQEAPTYELWDFGVVPRPSVMEVLLSLDPVQDELKMTDAQKKEYRAVSAREDRELQQKMQQARRNNQEREKLQAAVVDAAREAKAKIRAIFKPEQWERLDQIQLQAQGPLAFDRNEAGPWAAMANVGPSLAERFKLSDDQVKRIRTIAQQGGQEIQKAASFPIVMEAKTKPPSKEEIYKLLDSPEFKAAKQKARQAGRDAWAAVIRRIEDVLTPEQREAYHKTIGAPFDFAKLTGGMLGQQERMGDIQTVAQAFGGGGQGGGASAPIPTSMPRWPTRPMPAGRGTRASSSTRPTTTSTPPAGRYKPFAELITSDGYQVIAQQDKFTRDVLQKGDILVIANALSAEEWTPDPAFTDAECDAVRDWVKDGGSLLLITDHAPFGSAAEGLAKRFGVKLSTGAVGDPKNSEGGETSLVFSRQNHLLGDHPITRGRDDSERVNKVQTFTGTSLNGAGGERPDPQAGRYRGRLLGRRQRGLGGRTHAGPGLPLRQGSGRGDGRGRRALGPGHRGG